MGLSCRCTHPACVANRYSSLLTSVVSQASEMFIPAPFMRPLGGDQVLGALYEMRMYTYQPGALAEVIKSGTDATDIPHPCP